MRKRLLITVSSAVLCLASSSAWAVASTAADNNGSPTEKLRRLTPPSSVAPPLVVEGSVATAGYGTAHSIATNYFHWDNTATGAGVVIGVVDSGVDLDHPELAGRVLKGACFGGASNICNVTGGSVGGDPGKFPAQTTHGTHVAGIAAGKTVGIAPGATILPVKVCDTYSSSCPGNTDAGILWAAQHGAKVINLSLAGSFLSNYDVSVAAQAIASGALLVVAAGNGGTSKHISGYLGGAALKDGVRGGLIVVGAVGSTNKIASYSQTPGSACETHGGTSYCMRDYFVVAPGTGIKSSVGGGALGTLSGTSMAAPFVSGVAALIKSRWSYLKPTQISNIIFETATDLGTPGPDSVYGRGEVNIVAAMQPVGGETVAVVTSGPTITKAKGKKGALSTASVGTLSAPLKTSALLKNVVLVDAFGRDYNADLTGLAQTRSFSITGYADDPFRRISPIAFAGESALGAVSLTGYVEERSAPQNGASNGLTDIPVTSAQNIALSVSPAKGLSFDAGHNLTVSGYFNRFDTRASDTDASVFLSAAALNSPYIALADGANFAGSTVEVADHVRLRVGYATTGGTDRPQWLGLTPGANPSQFQAQASDLYQRQAHAAIAGITWDFADWGGVALTGTSTKEENSVLGGYTAGAFAIADTSSTMALGLSARMALGDGWATTLAWNEGVTQLGLAANSLFSQADALRSRAYGVAVTKHEIFGGDTVGFALTRPLHIYAGGATLRAATGVAEDQTLIYGTEHLGLASATPETDFEFGYATSLFGGRMTLQADAAYQRDVEGEGGQDAVTAIARGLFRF